MNEPIGADPLEDESLALPEEWAIGVPRYGDNVDGGAIDEAIDTLLRLLASHGSDLRSLDGVTLAADCRAVAAQLQKWPDDKGPTYREETAHAVEMGRTVAVWRGTELRFHIVLQEAFGLLALSEELEDCKLAMSCLAHEAAHVEHEGNLFRNCRHIFGGPLPCGERSSRLFMTAMDTWSEYAACRSSAFFRPDAVKEFDELFHTAIQEATGLADSSETVSSKPQEAICGSEQRQQMIGGLFICAGYLLGHIDGLPFHFERFGLRAMEQLQNRPGIHEIFLRVHEALEHLWRTESSWTGLDAFFPLYDLLAELINMDVARWKSSMPFLVQTTPNKSD
jgi:hypothetical protein